MDLVSHKLVYFIQFALVVINLHIHLASAEVGVVYGLNADNLPSTKDAVQLFKDNNINLVRLHQPYTEELRALFYSGIKVAVGVKLQEIEGIGNDLNVARSWVKDHIVPYERDAPFFRYITVGIDLEPSGTHILKAMINIQTALRDEEVLGIKISTIVNINTTLAIYSPPSDPRASEFTDSASEAIKPITAWLNSNKNPLFVNVYPYEAITNDLQSTIKLNYTLFREKEPIVFNSHGYNHYYNAFEAMVDSFYEALEKIGWKDATLVVGETGWPNLGEEIYATKENAQAYNQGLIDKMSKGGTPKKPKNVLDIFIQSMFDEDKEPEGTKRNMGIFYQDKNRVYPLNFPPKIETPSVPIGY